MELELTILQLPKRSGGDDSLAGKSCLSLREMGIATPVGGVPHDDKASTTMGTINIKIPTDPLRRTFGVKTERSIDTATCRLIPKVVLSWHNDVIHTNSLQSLIFDSVRRIFR